MSNCNRAHLGKLEQLLRSSKYNQCVFISHKKEDQKAALAIGNYLNNVVGIDTYLDINDCELTEAVSCENDQRIVDTIKKGLTGSTHLLCLVSDKTRLSWWVPYEIGFAEKQDIDIAVLKLKGIDDIPSYLKIKNTMLTLDDFLKYVSGLSIYGTLFAEKRYYEFASQDTSEISRYID